MRELFVLVGGPPAAGKTTVARLLATHLDLPLLSKDTIKHGLLAALGDADDLERSRALGRAAVSAMLAVAAEQPGGVLDSTWYDYTRAPVAALRTPIVEVRCTCPPQVLRRRYRARMPQRPAGDLQAQRTEAERLDPVHDRQLGAGPLVRVDTTRPVDGAALAARILALAAGPAPTNDETTAP